MTATPATTASRIPDQHAPHAAAQRDEQVLSSEPGVALKRSRQWRWLPCALTLLAAVLPTCTALAQRDLQSLTGAPAGPAQWVSTWTAALEAPYPGETLPAGALNGATLRQTIHLSAGGNRIRLRLSNRFGEAPLELRNVTVAIPGGAKPDGTILPTSWKPVLFGGRPGTAIAPGADLTSDALNYNVRAGTDLVLSLSITAAPSTLTLHAGARETAFLLPGDHSDEAALPGATTNTRWYFLSGVDVEERTARPAAIVAFGDSITDGHGATTDANDRWPDDLFRRLAQSPQTATLGVANEGIGGNCILRVCVGPSAVDRFTHDALEVPGAKIVILLEGINDLGSLSRTAPQPAAAHTALLQSLQAAMTRLVAQAHGRGMRVLGGTLTPWVGGTYYHPDAQSEADRVALNTWIRTSGTFDGVIDFDEALRDPAHPDRMLPSYDSGDHLHPGPAGYQRMADTIRVDTLR